MAKKNALRDVDPFAITICKQGANRQRIFLRKSAPAEAMLELPGGEMPLLKSAGWSAFYCVVAEPGAEEDPGLVGDRDSVDVWESEDEIRKAAHRLLKNGAYVNAEHDAEAEAGCAIVESAVALADLELDGGTIKKGSWYVAIEPTEEFRKAVDAGEITGVSLEGTGVRVSIEKAADFSERIGAADLRESMWRAFSTLEETIYTALSDEEEGDPQGVVKRSLEQFSSYLTEKLDAAPAGLRKRTGTVASNPDHEETDMGLAEDFAALKKQQEDSSAELKADLKKNSDVSESLVGLVGKLVDRVENLAGAAGAAKEGASKEDEPTDVKKVVDAVGKLADRLDSFDSELTNIAKSVSALGSGDSSQRDEGEPVRKAKSDNPLAGLLD